MPKEEMHNVTVAEMRELESRAEREYGLTPSSLMEHAGRRAAEILAQHIRHQRAVTDLEFFIPAGPGNNGGDGLYHTGIISERRKEGDRYAHR